MTDRPILFSAPMIRALLEGRKTQTRRALKPQPDDLREGQIPKSLRIGVGDRLWVREAITRFDKGTCDQWVWYRAGGNLFEGHAGGKFIRDNFPQQDPGDLWRAPEGPAGGTPYSVLSIYMPRWASRLTLIVTDVRVQRLQDISEEEAIAEGVGRDVWSSVIPSLACPDHAPALPPQTPVYWAPDDDRDDLIQFSARRAYERLWNTINGGDVYSGAWDDNPWIAAYSFTVHKCNIDDME